MPVTPKLAVIAPAPKLPVASRFTIALAVLTFVGGTLQLSPSVPLLVMGEPLTVKSDAGADSATLVTLPLPLPPGNVCPGANAMMPLGPIRSPVSAGLAVPSPYSKFSVAPGLALLLLACSACHRNV